MKLKDILQKIPNGIMDHVRIFAGQVRIYKYDAYIECNVLTIAPALKCQHCTCSSIYDAYMDIFIDSDVLPF